MDLVCEERPSDSPFVEGIWRSRSEVGGQFISMAEMHCELVVTRYQDTATLTVRGPETRFSPAVGPAETEFLGIRFKPGTFMPHFLPTRIRDRNDVNLPEEARGTFWLHGQTWQFPDFENADTFVNWLIQAGLLVHDPVVSAVLQGQAVDMSPRTVQRHFLRATGLTQSAYFQIERARYATSLLKQGTSILDTVDEAGYFDQPHLTRALKHLIGLTPAQIANQNRTEQLSFLYKTTPLRLNYDSFTRQFSAERELLWEQRAPGGYASPPP